MCCSICYEDIDEVNRLELNCKHVFHISCYMKYTESKWKHEKTYEVTCPYCRQVTIMSKIPAPKKEVAIADRYKLCISNLCKCTEDGCDQIEQIGNERKCCDHNDLYKSYTKEMFELAFEFTYRIGKCVLQEKKIVIFDVVLKCIRKLDLKSVDEIINVLAPVFAELGNGYAIPTLYTQLKVPYNNLLKSTVE